MTNTHLEDKDMKKEKRVSVTEGMDKTGWVRDTWRPGKHERGYSLPQDDFYECPLIPRDPYSLGITSLLADREYVLLVDKIRKEELKNADEAFHEYYRKTHRKNHSK